MSEVVVYGFPRSTFVNIVRLVLTHKEVPYTFQDLEPEMGKPGHLALHPLIACRSCGMVISRCTRRAQLSPISMRHFRDYPCSQETSRVGPAWTNGSVWSIPTTTRT